MYEDILEPKSTRRRKRKKLNAKGVKIWGQKTIDPKSRPPVPAEIEGEKVKFK